MTEKSPELFINIKNKPKWIEGSNFNGQSQYTKDFWLGEAKKVKHGITIGGFKFHPWLYWHINFWHILTDVKDNNGVINRVPKIASFRDNEWFINENLVRAEEEKKGIAMFGTRRFSKSAFISSYTGHSASTKYGGVNSVVGGVQKDLDNVTQYIDFGLDRLPEFFKFDRVGKDWSKGVTLGKRMKSSKKDIFSTMVITNVNMGKQSSSQKTAGLTPSSFVMDEIGKYPCKKVFNTAKYSFSSEFGWRCIPVLLGTGGETSQAKDAESIINNPDLHNLITMDWRLLERNCKNPTWIKKKWSVFVPAQMSIEPGLIKIDTTLDKHLKVENKELSKIKIKQTDWNKATKILRDRRAKLKEGDNETYIDEMMFLPLDTDDCFLRQGSNPFPSLEASRHRKKLVEEGNIGKKVEVFYKNGNNLGYEFSDKPLAKFPFEGGILDCAVQIFEDPPEDNELDGTYVAGLDHYKHVKADTDSVGAFYVFKRMVNLNDPWANRIVASYCSRPSTHKIFNNTAERLMEGYGAEVLQENADLSFQQHLEEKNKEIRWLANGEDLAKLQINPRASQNNKYGLSPTSKNQEFLRQAVVDYCQENIVIGQDENGQDIIMKGVERIPDIYLLDEIIGFKYGGNFDRIIAFGHALVWARYLDKLNVMPKVKKDKKDLEYRKEKYKNRIKSKSMYSSKRYGMY